MIAVVVLAAASWTAVAGTARISSLEKDVRTLQDRVRRLSYNSASGGGINLKMMPDTKTGRPTVPLEEVFSFDRNHALCRVDSNPQAFRLPTYSRGNLVVEPHRFFMSMAATSIDQYEVSTRADGKRQVRMRGGLSCATEIGQATVTLGSRTAAEHASYLIEAVDGGIGGGRAGDSFAFTVFFAPREAPVNYSLFGPKFTFTGRMVEGEITIVDTHIP